MNRILPMLVGLAALIGVASSMLFVVDQRQYAAVFALGELKEVITKPGLHWKLPPPFQNVVYFDNRILTIDTADVDRFITSEKLNVMIDTFVKWRIVDPRKFFTSVGGSEAVAVDRLQRSLRDSLNNEVAKKTANAVVIEHDRARRCIVSMLADYDASIYHQEGWQPIYALIKQMIQSLRHFERTHNAGFYDKRRLVSLLLGDHRNEVPWDEVPWDELIEAAQALRRQATPAAPLPPEPTATPPQRVFVCAGCKCLHTHAGSEFCGRCSDDGFLSKS